MKKKWEDQWDRLYHEAHQSVYGIHTNLTKEYATKNKIMKMGSSQRSISIELLQIQMQDIHKLHLVNKHPRLRKMSTNDFHSAQKD
ncbi:hypothetical protein SNEBB_004092 [Seison nebaliae]|nr:hypothetical protein SNEBB_004092 [Seison nebaliae]